MVIAEGFLNHLPNHKEIIGKLCQLINPGGIGIISQDDRYGYFLEMLRKLIFWRVCWLAKVKEQPIERSIKIANTLFAEEFSKLNASRPFSAWYLDNLVNPITGLLSEVSGMMWLGENEINITANQAERDANFTIERYIEA